MRKERKVFKNYLGDNILCIVKKVYIKFHKERKVVGKSDQTDQKNI